MQIHPLLHAAMIDVFCTKERSKSGSGIFVQQDKILVPHLLIAFFCCHNYYRLKFDYKGNKLWDLLQCVIAETLTTAVNVKERTAHCLRDDSALSPL